MPKRSSEQLLDAGARTGPGRQPAADDDVRRQRREARRHRPDVQVVHLDHVGVGARAPRRSRARPCPAGAASIKTSSGSLSRRHELAAISPRSGGSTSGSTAFQPVASTTTPATTTPSELSASPTEWRSTASRLMSSRSPRASTRSRRRSRPGRRDRARARRPRHVGRIRQAARSPRPRSAPTTTTSAMPLTNAPTISLRWSP